MSENLRLWTQAIYGFDHVALWRDPTSGTSRRRARAGPRHVIGHVLAIQRYMEALVRGTRPTMNPMVDPHLHAGDDPYATWAAARDGVLEAVDHPGVLHRVVTNWSGPTSVDDMLGGNVADTTIHAWDLARALGVDDRLDPACVARAYDAAVERGDGLRAGGMFGPAVEVPDDADPQSRLLALTGRRP
ncbi:MAG: TIGR03086 family metal-binding protein [Ilumatobacteraceae bacterium]